MAALNFTQEERNELWLAAHDTGNDWDSIPHNYELLANYSPAQLRNEWTRIRQERLAEIRAAQRINLKIGMSNYGHLRNKWAAILEDPNLGLGNLNRHKLKYMWENEIEDDDDDEDVDDDVVPVQIPQYLGLN